MRSHRPSRLPKAILAAVLLVTPVQLLAHAGIAELESSSAEEVARRPDDPQAHLERARVLRLAHRWDEALEQLGVAARRGADPDEVGATRVAILLDAGKAAEAIDEADLVLARRPDAYGLLFERGRALLALGRAEEAARDFGRAIQGMPEPQPEQVLARRDALLSLGRREEAVSALDAGMARIGRVVSLELPAIDLEVELGRYDAALGRLDGLLARGAPNPAWVARRGEILEKAGKKAEARAEYERALAIIARRSPDRRAKAFDDLKRRLETELAAAANGGERR